MMMCRYMIGEKVDLSTIDKRKALVGKCVKYLRPSDIDKSGRGLVFPRVAIILSAKGRQMELDNGDWLSVSNVVEMTIVED